jgi:hypothetical protein
MGMLCLRKVSTQEDAELQEEVRVSEPRKLELLNEKSQAMMVGNLRSLHVLKLNSIKHQHIYFKAIKLFSQPFL